MSGERYADLAVTALLAYLETGLGNAIAAVEVAQGLADGALERPLAFIPATIEHDNRPRLVGVTDDATNPVSQRNGVWSIPCTIAMTQMGSANITENATKLRRWVTALIDLLVADPTLGGEVISAIIQPGGAAGTLGDQSATRLVYLFPVEVRVNA